VWKKKLLDFIHMPGSHTGEMIAELVFKAVNEAEISWDDVFYILYIYFFLIY
jgi:hypothetical protein